MNPTVKKKNVLVCPLDWGLGHATRCVPVINEFLRQGAGIMIAASGRPLAFLRKEFPGLNFVEFPGYDIRYPENNGMALSMLFSSPRIFKTIRKENESLEKILSENKIDIVLSDNRFGLHSMSAYCIYMTHQVMIKCPPLLKPFEYFLWRMHRSFIKKYDECWIPDFREEKNLSGDLAHKYSTMKNSYFIGPLSRFEHLTSEEQDIKPQYDVIFVLSGPEPQRTIFEDIAAKEALRLKHLKVLIVKGLTEKENEKKQKENLTVVSYLESGPLREALIRSKLVVCRPGYSSIMDLVRLHKKAVFVPTPGQTEQIYLAKKFYQENLFFFMKQDMFRLDECIKRSVSYPGLSMHTERKMISDRIKYLLEN